MLHISLLMIQDDVFEEGIMGSYNANIQHYNFCWNRNQEICKMNNESRAENCNNDSLMWCMGEVWLDL